MTIDNRLKGVFSKIFDIDLSYIDKDSSPDTIENWDSLNHMNLIIALEQEFNLSFSMGEIVEMLNYQLIVIILESKGIK